MHPLALACTALLGLFVFGPGLAVSMLRLRTGPLGGLPSDARSLRGRTIRAHGNPTGYAPQLAVPGLWFGAHAPSATTLAVLAGVTACRVWLVVGRLAWPDLNRPNPARFVGAPGTGVPGGALCLRLLPGLG